MDFSLKVSLKPFNKEKEAVHDRIVNGFYV